MKLALGDLRKIIRQVLLESYGGPLGVNPAELDVDFKGFYPYDVERGVDVYEKWYRSPGESEGDPGRPADAAEYIGMTAVESEAGSTESGEGSA